MLKQITTILTFAILFSTSLFGQGLPTDPLARVRDLINSDEIILISSKTLGSDPSKQNVQGRIMDLDITQTNPDSRLLPKSIQSDSTVTGNKRLSVTCGNFLGDRYKHFVAACTGSNNSITLMIPQISNTALNWTNVNRLTLPNVMMSNTISPKTPVRVAAGNFFGDAKEEFVLGYIGKDSSLKLKMFTVNSSLVPVKGDSINNEKISFPSGQKIDAFDLAVGDFDGDGWQEIAAVFVKKGTGSTWSISVRIYKINSFGGFVSKGTANLFATPSYNISNIQISVSSRDFNYDAVDEIAAGFAFTHSQMNQPGTYIDIVEVRDSLNTVVTNSSRRVTLPVANEGESRPFDISVADLNGDGKNDIAASTRGSIYGFTVDSTLVPQLRVSGPSIPGWGNNAYTDFSQKVLTASDLDYNRKADIIAVSAPYDLDNFNLQYFNVYVYEASSDFSSFILRGRKEKFDSTFFNGNLSNVRQFYLASGDFNGDRVRLGSAAHYRKTLIKQPLVVLNTPPVHFDVLNGTAYDLSGCYPNFGCGFSSDYIQSSTIDTTMTVEVHNDWGVDATLGAGGSVFGIGVQASIKTSYAEGFKNVKGSGSTIRVTEGRRAEGGDWTFNIVNDYDFYEYAVYDSLNNFRGNILTVVPGPTTKLWIEAKDDYAIGNIYRPEHEVGNILSYRDSVSLAEDTAQLIYQFNPQTVGSSGSSFTELDLQNFHSSGAETSNDVGVEVGGSISGWGIEVGVNGSYSQGQISNVTTTVNSSVLLRGDYGHLNPPFNLPQNTYYIIPYAYWAKNGALILDYKVKLNSNPGSFWNANYGNKTDLSFNLPWRLDPEKGYPLPGNDQEYRYRSRDIRISKFHPDAGDTVTIKAKVSNYGLLDITAPVTVRFYRGNPAAGGIQIGQTTISGGIQIRKSKYASIQWTVPDAIPGTTRIYAVIDPENQITNEVHEENNQGWTPLSDFSIITVISSGTGNTIPDKMELMQNYPNPFNPATTITFSVTVSGLTTLKIYDMLGREVTTMINEKLEPGNYNLRFDAGELTSGTYFYKLKCGDFVQTRKMTLLK